MLHVAGPRSRQLIADSNAGGASPEAVKRLKEVQFVTGSELKESLAETVQRVDGMLQHASSGQFRNIPRFLFTVSKAAKYHPALLTELQKSPYRDQILKLLPAASVERSAYNRAIFVSQLCTAQYLLGVFCCEFWEGIPQQCISL